MKLSWRQAAVSAGSLSALLVGYGANQLWSDSRDHERRISAVEGQGAILQEIRDEQKEMRAEQLEIRDAVRRLEGARDVSRGP